jgi:hypothetical protein
MSLGSSGDLPDPCSLGNRPVSSLRIGVHSRTWVVPQRPPRHSRQVTKSQAVHPRRSNVQRSQRRSWLRTWRVTRKALGLNGPTAVLLLFIATLRADVFRYVPSLDSTSSPSDGRFPRRFNLCEHRALCYRTRGAGLRRRLFIHGPPRGRSSACYRIRAKPSPPRVRAASA